MAVGVAAHTTSGASIAAAAQASNMLGIDMAAVAVITVGAGGVFLAIYAGLYGPWDYYLKEAYGKQLW